MEIINIDELKKEILQEVAAALQEHEKIFHKGYIRSYPDLFGEHPALPKKRGRPLKDNEVRCRYGGKQTEIAFCNKISQHIADKGYTKVEIIYDKIAKAVMFNLNRERGLNITFRGFNNLKGINSKSDVEKIYRFFGVSLDVHDIVLEIKQGIVLSNEKCSQFYLIYPTMEV